MLKESRNLLSSLCIYRNLLQDPVINALLRTFDRFVSQKDSHEAINEYHNLLFKVFNTGHSFREHLLHLIVHDDNPFSQQAERLVLENLNRVLLDAVRHDLEILQRIYKLDFEMLAKKLNLEYSLIDYLPASYDSDSDIKYILHNSPNWPDQVEELARHYARHSRGIVSVFPALRWDVTQGLLGIDNPDPIKMGDLIGYESQKEEICRNTEQFLKACSANNILLYGSRGTGKSSMVKALLNQYSDYGLRLVEVGRDILGTLPALVATLRQYSLKFVIFIDDLSFEDYETEYKGLKAVMEGSLETQPPNVLIYATSNRRHLVREFFSDRGKVNDEIHLHDSMQEKLSLADRFGLSITFPAPGQQTYLEIVEKLASKRRIAINSELLRRKALEWERVHHGPSGRTARQFVDSLGAHL